MYGVRIDKETAEEIPFDIICTNCNSHNVSVTAFEDYNLEIRCLECGHYIDYGRYNPTRFIY